MFPFALMDGSNLQFLIAPKKFMYDSSPKSHMREEKGQKPRQEVKSAELELLEKEGGGNPHLSLIKA